MQHAGNGGEIHINLVTEPEGKTPVERLRCRWEDNIKIDIERSNNVRVWTEFTWLKWIQ
jgi:hypothetical protein